MDPEELRDEETDEQDVVELAEEPELVSEGYDFVMGGRPTQRLVIADYFKGADPESFIEAKGTNLKEDDIIAAGVDIEMDGGAGGNRAARRAARKGKGQAGGTGARLRPKPNHAFVAKCRVQITDFRLRYKDAATDQVGVLAFGSANKNDEIYVSWLLPGNEPMRDIVEGFLDKLAGRDTPAQEDFEALGNAR